MYFNIKTLADRTSVFRILKQTIHSFKIGKTNICFPMPDFSLCSVKNYKATDITEFYLRKYFNIFRSVREEWCIRRPSAESSYEIITILKGVRSA